MVKKTIQKKIAAKKVEEKIKEEVKEEVKVEIFDDLQNKFLLVKVGNDIYPAKNEQIKEIEEKLTSLLEEHKINCLAFVTHHYVDFQILEKK